MKNLKQTENVGKEKQSWRLVQSDFKNFCTATETQRVWCGGKDRYVSQWSRTESPESDPCLHGQLIFKQRAKYDLMEKELYFQQSAKTTETTRNKQTLPHSIHNNELKMDHRPKTQAKNHRISIRKHRRKCLQLGWAKIS